MVEKDLLPSLCFTAASMEALRVFLILPEFLRVLIKQGHETRLTSLFASAILNLDPCMQTMLGKHMILVEFESDVNIQLWVKSN